MVGPGADCNFGGGGPGTDVPIETAGGGGSGSSTACLGLVLRGKSSPYGPFGDGRFGHGGNPVIVIVGAVVTGS